MSRIPTEKQAARLALVAHPDSELLSSTGKPGWVAVEKRGWLERGRTAKSLRITPAGLRALADALETYGRSKEAANG